MHGVVPVDFPCRKSFEYFLECDSSFEPGQCSAEAEVDAVAKRKMLAGLAPHVERVGIREFAFVAIGRCRQQQYGAASGNGDSVMLNICGDVASLDR